MFTALQGKVTIGTPTTSLASNARTSFAAMASLLALLPIELKAVPGQEAAVENAFAQNSQFLDAYSNWLTDKNLSGADREAGKETYTQRWIDDRSSLLGVIADRNTRIDQTLPLRSWAVGTDIRLFEYADPDGTKQRIDAFDLFASDTTPDSERIRFRFGGEANEFIVGGKRNDHLYGGGGLDQINAGDGNDYLEGNADFDSLYGEKDADTLLGGAGDDWLDGGAGNDLLLGGQGTDTYVIGAGGGFDIIRDADGLGSIRLGGATLVGGTEVAAGSGLYLSADKSVSYALSGDPAGAAGATLLISGEAAQVRVEGYHSGNLGLTLGPATAQAPAAPQTGEHDYVQGSLTGGGLNGLEGNDILVNGNFAEDQFMGGLGADLLLSGPGDDRLDGGDGADLLNGGAGHDLIWGGAGDDLVIGNLNYASVRVTGSLDEQNWAQYAAGWSWQWATAGAPGARLNYVGQSDEVGASWQLSASAPAFGVVNAIDPWAIDTAQGDVVFAGVGNDFVIGGEGGDVLRGEADMDVLIGNGGADALFGGSGVDELAGGGGDDYLDGGTEADKLIGGYEADTLYGDAGNDELWGDLPALAGTNAPPLATDFSRMGDDWLDGEDGDDTLWGGGGEDALWGGIGADTLYGDGLGTPATYEGQDYLDGEAGNDQLVGGGNADVLYGGTGNDMLLGDGPDSAVEAASDGADLLDGGEGDDFLAGGGGADTLLGGAGNDDLVGGSGNDMLRGGAGVDALDGGAGNDTYVFDAADVPLGFGERVTDAQGTNTVEISGAVRVVASDTGADLWLALGAPGEARVIALTDALRGAGVQNLVIDGASLSARQWVKSNLTLDTSVSSSAAGQTLFTGRGADMLVADHAVTLAGGQGSDTLRINATGVTAEFDLGDGQDALTGTLVATAVPAPGAANVARFGAGVDALTLQLAATSLGTGHLDLRLNYGTGTDSIGIGMDNLANGYVAHSFDRYEFADGTVLGWDQLAARGVALDMTAGSVGPRYGTALADRITGSQWADTIYGGAGDDVIDGGTGNDALYGEAGLNTYLFGYGSGQDSVVAGAQASDVVQFKLGVGPSNLVWLRLQDDLVVKLVGTNDRLTVVNAFAGGPVGQFRFADGTLLPFASITLTPAQGQATQGADQIYLQASGEAVDALGGDDVVYGQAGNDQVSGGDGFDYLLGDAGNDTLRGDGGADTLSGEAGDDVLEGGDSNDTLSGGAGSDTLNGGTGTDYLSGGDGADVLIDTLGDGDTLVGGTGADTFRVGLALGAGSVTVVGAADGDVIILNAGILPQQVSVRRSPWDAGALDLAISTPQLNVYQTVTLAGFASSPNAPPIAQVQFASAPGTVWPAADVLGRLGLGTPANDTLNGLDNYGDTLQGLAGNDTLGGLGGDDDLDGGVGYDTLYGGAGNDTYRFGFGKGADHAIESVGQGADRVRLDAGVVPADVTLFRVATQAGESLVLRLADGSELWLEAYFGAGSPGAIERIEFDNGVVWQYADVIARVGAVASGVANAMTGSAGNDNFVVDHPLDTIAETAGGGTDSVVSNVSYVLPANVENLQLTGVLSISATGNLGDNVLVGNAGDNLLDNGGRGADQLRGGAGNDTYRVMTTDSRDGFTWQALSQPLPGAVIELPGEGDDELVTNAFSATLPDNVEKLKVSGDMRFNSVYVNGATVFEYAYRGNALNNVIDLGELTWGRLANFGYPNRTLLDGGAGADLLIGSDYDDTYVVDTALDTVVETGFFVFATGTSERSTADRVAASFSYTLGAHLEQLELRGTGAISGTGNELDNFIDGAGNSAANVLTGGAGNDTYRLGAGDTIVELAGEGDDSVVLAGAAAGQTVADLSNWGNVENLRVEPALATFALNGTAAANVLIGNAASNTISGGAGSDTLYDAYVPDMPRDGLGRLTYPRDADELYGGDGDDVLVSYSGADILDGGAGNDAIEGYSNAFNVNAYRVRFGVGSGLDTLSDYGAELSEAARAGSTWIGPRIELTPGTNAQDLRFERSGDSLLIRLNANDALTIASFFVEGSAAIRSRVDAIVLADGSVLTRDAIRAGLAGGDRITAGAGDDLLIAGSGLPSTITGGAGSDFIVGGSSSDILQGGVGNDWLQGGAGSDQLDGGTGNDLLVGGIGADSYWFSAGWGSDQIDDLKARWAQVDGIVPVDDGAVDEIVFDASVAQGDVAFQLNNSDLLITRAGSTDALTVVDYLNSPAGAIERIRFADGTTLARADVVRLASTIRGTAGDDTLYASAFDSELFGLGGQDSLFGQGGNDILHGDDGNDALAGDAGNDTLDGGTGNDAMIGGTGNDIYLVDAVGDVVTELANEGSDTVRASISWTLGANVENLTLTGTTPLNGTGNALANLLVGNAAANTLSGGTGADTLAGGAGNDTYVVDNAGDVVTEALGEGTDLVQSGVSYTLGASLENLTLTGSAPINATGNGLDNTLVGNSGVNVLAGGAGNDTYVVGSGDSTVEAAGEGTDSVQAGVTWTLANNVENLTLTGSNAINGTGNALNNVLTGNSAVNTLTGGAGDDTYVVGTGDITTEAASAGIDTVLSSVTWTLATNLENLTLTGTANVNATGNTVANVITGNAGNNAINGGTGADTMIGGVGNDSYTVDNPLDVITELAGEGVDAVTSSVTYTLSANVENLTLSGTTVFNGTGNGLDNVLTGNSANNTLTGLAGNDTLDGGLGNDTMLGGAGNDTYVVNVATDVVTELANEGIDTINAALTWTIVSAANVENVTLTGTGTFNATGNSLDNVLIGNSANNTMTGNAGNDTLDGGLGNDTMVGGAGNDTYVVNVATDVVTELANEGTDTVLSAVTLTLGNNVENLTLTGTGAINATGNTLNNVLIGNAGANVLAGAAGDDTYSGAAGNDTFTDTSTTSNDTYLWGTGSGLDTLTDSGGALDHVDLFAGITAAQLKFTRNVNNLELSILGNTLDKLTINGWYTGSANQIEEFRLADGSKVLAGQVNSLLSAMASFGGSASTGLTGPTMRVMPVRPVAELAMPWTA